MEARDVIRQGSAGQRVKRIYHLSAFVSSPWCAGNWSLRGAAGAPTEAAAVPSSQAPSPIKLFARVQSPFSSIRMRRNYPKTSVLKLPLSFVNFLSFRVLHSLFCSWASARMCVYAFVNKDSFVSKSIQPMAILLYYVFIYQKTASIQGICVEGNKGIRLAAAVVWFNYILFRRSWVCVAAGTPSVNCGFDVRFTSQFSQYRTHSVSEYSLSNWLLE